MEAFGTRPLFLFDIDGTLMRGAPPIHREAICAAARAIYGVNLAAADLGKTAGMTDSAIARRALRSAGVGDSVITEGLPAFYLAAADAYERTVPDDLSAHRTPHAAEALDWLADRGATLGLVTGNIQRLAWAKLGAAGLSSRFHIASAPGPLPWIGGFGDDAEDRDALPPVALERAARALPAGRVGVSWIVGDTPADIRCGQASGMRVIAVATGPSYSEADLRALDPTHVITDLTALASLPIWSAA